MHICFAIPEYPPHPGGIATYYSHLIALLGSANHRVTLLTTQEGVAQKQASHVQIIDLSAAAKALRPSTARLLPRNWGLVLKVITESMAARDWLRAHAVDADIDVIACADFLSWAGMLIEPDLPPVAVTCHGSNQQIIQHSPGRQADPQTNYIQSIEALSLLRADGLNAYSPLNIRFWEPVLERNVSLTRSPWILTHRGPATTRVTDRPKGVVIGRLQTWKGAEVLARALGLLQEKNIPVHIDWYGGDTTAPDGQPSMAEFLRNKYPDVMHQCLHYHGEIPREAVAQTQMDADFVVVPSTWDTFNFTVLEALEKGKPTIVSDACGAAYLIESDTHGLVFESNQAAQLAAAIERISDSHSMRVRLGTAAFQHIHSYYAPENILADHMTFFQSTLDRRQQHPQRARILGAAVSPLIDSPLLPEAMLANLDNFPAHTIMSGIRNKIQKRLAKN